MSQTSKRRRSEPWVGPWLRAHRLDSGATSEQIAKKLGVGRSSVSRLESGASSIAADDIPVVLRAYDLSPAKFAARAAKAA